jgi:hypothetical protein
LRYRERYHYDIAAMDPAEATQLLLKAANLLPADERDSLLAYLVERGLTAGAGSGTRESLMAASEQMVLRAGITGPSAMHRTLPIRLPERDYDRLKAWSGEHDFPMAVIIRGLVERFLDAQGA